ncbi:hypothetical protein OG874_24700 [Nocardia sp. NBC_00565]|uniref:hypothetical protein n=1 Tax=Nocardia sp. NBC_00565 TaxID=2975993 RepID=UPI002E80FA30|nr:hypothetical protein [Nocardia sp. NBC_00565]WUC00104.1 hypothetical protein OG874_24700 [Nocardia sp. NBC_00565]
MTARYRVEWYPGTDQLLGVCHCGATHVADDPIEVWQWLLAHPAGHTGRLPDPRYGTLTGARA